MSLLQTLKLAHLPEDLLVHIALYNDVKNAAFLQQQLLEGNSAYEYAFIDASIVCQAANHMKSNIVLIRPRLYPQLIY